VVKTLKNRKGQLNPSLEDFYKAILSLKLVSQQVGYFSSARGHIHNIENNDYVKRLKEIHENAKVHKDRFNRKLVSRYLTEVLHILIALELVLAYFYLLELFQPNYVILSRGVVWGRVYRLGLVDYGLLLPLVVALALSLCVYKFCGFKTVKPSKLAVYILAILTFMSSLPFAYWITYIWSPQVSQDHSLIGLSELDAGLFHVYASAYPMLTLTALYAWLPLLIGRAFKRYVRLKIRYNKTLNIASDCASSDNVLIKRLGITSVLLLSIILPIIPYLPSINPNFKPVSVDIRYYSIWLNEILSRDCWSAVEYAFYGMGNGNRPLYLMLLYCLVSLGIPKQVMLNFEALLISPFFALTVYYTANRLSGSEVYALSASLAGLLGFNMTVGMMAGFFAAWTALIPFYICVALTPGLAGGSLKSLAIVLASSIAMLYIHPWTWSLLMAILTLHLASSILDSLRKGNFKLDRRLLAVLIGNATADVVKTYISPSYGGLASSTRALGNSRAFGFEPLLDLPRNLHRLTVSYVDGLFFNPLHMALALIGILSLSKKGDSLSRLFVIWLAVVSLIFPFSHIALQSHLLFATPFPILIAEGLWALSRLLARFDSKLPKLLYVFFITSSLTYTVRALCNLI